MPYVSEAQRRKFHAMENRGEISPATVREWDKATKGKKLPQHVKKAAELGFALGYSAFAPAIEKAARKMPHFTSQKRPEKVKDVYKAIKREHPGMPAATKARIASRVGEGKKPGPPYKGKLTGYGKEAAEFWVNPMFAGKGGGGGRFREALRRGVEGAGKALKFMKPETPLQGALLGGAGTAGAIGVGQRLMKGKEEPDGQVKQSGIGNILGRIGFGVQRGARAIGKPIGVDPLAWTRAAGPGVSGTQRMLQNAARAKLLGAATVGATGYGAYRTLFPGQPQHQQQQYVVSPTPYYPMGAY